MTSYDDYNQWRVRQIYDQAVTEQQRAIGNSVGAIEKRNELQIRLNNQINEVIRKSKSNKVLYES